MYNFVHIPCIKCKAKFILGDLEKQDQVKKIHYFSYLYINGFLAQYLNCKCG